jgi:hypothetical protein
LEINHGVPLFLDQLVDALRAGSATSPAIDGSASRHGHDLLLRGFTVSQVVHDYGDVCQAVSELAMETDTPFSTEDFRLLNRCLDDAIAAAVTTHEFESRQASLDDAAKRGNERMGFLVHELRNLVTTAIVAFELLEADNAGVSGRTGAVLNRSLTGLRDLVAQSLGDIRLKHAATTRRRFPISELIGEVEAAATLAANARGVKLSVMPVKVEIAIEADKQVLAAVVMNLLQNAFKFTRPRTTVTLRAVTRAGRVLLDVQDECGGLPGGDVNELFRPFEQKSADRTGLGIGLPFSRWGAEANGGRLYACDLPDKGCIFTLDLPQSPGAGD